MVRINYNNKSYNKSPIKQQNTIPIKQQNTTPKVIPQQNNSIMNTVKDAVIYSTAFNGTSRILDGILGSRKVEVINNNDNDNNDYCTKIREKYNEDKYKIKV